MKRRLASILICICLAATVLLSACELFTPVTPAPVKLTAPVVSIDSSGNASWAKVANASGYVYKIDNGTEQTAASDSVTLTDGQSITVKAVGDGKKYTDSDWSASKKYTQQTVVPTPTKLSAPIVTVDANGNATWAKVANASGYVYKIDNGAEQTAASDSVTLTDGQSITVKAVGDGENYTDSDWSVPQTYSQSACNHIDEDGDAICDNCNQNFVCAHADADNNNVCDNCKRSLLVSFDFYAINDLHGMYADSDSQPGVDELTTYLLDAQKNKNSLVLSSGDMWQGSSESNNTKGKLATEWLNYVNCSAMTLGNHEFDWSTDKIRENAQLADFPFLAINVYEHSTNQRVPYCQASVVVTLQGVKIGIIGAIGDCYSSISASMCGDVYFKTGSELTALVRAEAERLRNEEDVNYIIYSIHDGDGQTMNHYDESLSNGLINVVFEGHSHKSYCIDDSYGVYHVQAGGYNAGISHAYVTYNILTEQSETAANVINNNVYKACESNNIINSLIEKYSNEIGNPDEVVGHIDTMRNSTALCNDMAAAYWQRGQKEWGSQYRIALAGGFIKARSPYNLNAGDITVKDIQTIFPFDNRIHLCTVKGSDLLARFFNNTGSDYYYKYDADIRAKLESGQGLNDTYYIVTDSYTTDFAPNNLTMVQEINGDVFPRTLLIDYIKSGSGDYGSSAPDTPATPEPAESKTIAELLAIGEALSDNAETTVEYSVSGVIKSIVHTTYGNCYITDGENELYIYGLYDESGTRYDKLTNKPVAGNSVVLRGKIKRHIKSDGTIVIEMLNAKIVSCTN